MVGEDGRAEHDDDVVALQLLRELSPRRGEEAGERGVILGEAAAPTEWTDPDRGAGELGQLHCQVPRAVTIDARADHQRRPSAPVQRRRGGRQPDGVADVLAVHVTGRDTLAGSIPVVLGDRHERRSAGGLHRHVVRACDCGGHVRGPGRLDRPLHIRPRQLSGLFGEQERLAHEELARTAGPR